MQISTWKHFWEVNWDIVDISARVDNRLSQWKLIFFLFECVQSALNSCFSLSAHLLLYKRYHYQAEQSSLHVIQSHRLGRCLMPFLLIHFFSNRCHNFWVSTRQTQIYSISLMVKKWKTNYNERTFSLLVLKVVSITKKIKNVFQLIKNITHPNTCLHKCYFFLSL